MSEFNERWDWALTRGTFQQESTELNHVYDLMKACDCKSYLEIGTAEGNSLYILGGAVKGSINFIDYGEEHTKRARAEALVKLDKMYTPFYCDSTKPNMLMKGSYDCILIDGGHDFATVLSDSINYAPLAQKFVFWHDIQLPEVKAAVEWFCHRWNLGKYSTFINSKNYGYGIVEIGK